MVLLENKIQSLGSSLGCRRTDDGSLLLCDNDIGEVKILLKLGVQRI